MTELCHVIESGGDRPVIDETHLKSRYDVDVHSEAVTMRQFVDVLCDELGLVMTPARRDVLMLVVRGR